MSSKKVEKRNREGKRVRERAADKKEREREHVETHRLSDRPT